MLIIIRLLILLILLLNKAYTNNIYIYADKGSCEECIQQCEKSFYDELTDDYQVYRITAAQILASGWQDNTALLVIPGGKAGPYAELLAGKGNDLIRKYIENGGAYLGFCAGAYYASASLEFAKGTSIEVIAERDLALFPGKIIGPALATYDYYSESGARAAKILTEGAEPLTIYYNGGGYFVEPQNYPNINIIASYNNLSKNPAAIIQIILNKGKVILSSVHCEFNSNVLNRVDSTLAPEINNIEKGRRKLWRYLLESLGLNLKLDETGL